MLFSSNKINNTELSFENLKDGNEISLNACVFKIKHTSKFSFIYLKKSDKIIKTVLRPLMCNKDVSQLSEGMFVSVFGIAKKEFKAENGIEINITDFSVLSEPYEKPPISVADKDFSLSVEDSLESKALALRHPEILKIYKTKSDIIRFINHFFEENNFIQVNTSLITSFTEKDSFSFDYFNQTAYLSSSPQLQLTPCTASMERVYELTHSFSSKKHTSTRHLNEFMSLDFQMGYVNEISELINFTILLINCILNNLNNTDIQLNVPIFTFNESLSILKKNNQPDMDPTDIKKICTYSKEKYNSDFVVVTDFSVQKRPFYAKDNADSFSSQCFDLYFNGLKIATGSINISDFEEQNKKLQQSFNNITPPSAYMDTLKYGIMPYGGVTLGIERFCMKYLGLENVRQTSVFPRDIHHIAP